MVGNTETIPKRASRNSGLSRRATARRFPQADFGPGTHRLQEIIVGQLVEYQRLNGIVPPMTQKYGLKVR
jgi:hypothetical protein